MILTRSNRNAALLPDPKVAQIFLFTMIQVSTLAQSTPPGGPGAGAVLRNTQDVLNLYIYDYSYDSWAHACSAAAMAGKTLVGTQHWLGLSTQTCLANVEMTGSGLLQPKAASVLTLAGSFRSPDVKALDTSLGGPGSIVFSGNVGRAHAEWFGAVLIPDIFGSVSSSDATANTLAVRSAIAAFPVVKGVFAKGGVPVRYGSAQFGCGTLIVNDTISSSFNLSFIGPAAERQTSSWRITPLRQRRNLSMRFCRAKSTAFDTE